MSKTTAENAATLEVLNSLTKTQWIEVYNTLPANCDACLAMKTDVQIEREGMGREDILVLVAHSRRIYDAVWQRVNHWRYADRDWRRVMVELLDILAPLAYCELCGAEPGKPHQQDVHEGKIPKIVTIHRWKSADGKHHRLCMHCRAGARQIPFYLTDKQEVVAKQAFIMPTHCLDPKCGAYLAGSLTKHKPECEFGKLIAEDAAEIREAFEAWFQAPVPLKRGMPMGTTSTRAYNAWNAFQAGWTAREVAR